LNRRYSDAEFRAILAKAVEESDGASRRSTDGITLGEIKEIGAQVGIDPVSLERAALSVTFLDRGRGAALAGAPISATATRRVDAELGSVPIGEILSIIRGGMGCHGEVSELKSLLEWRSSGELGHRTITLSASDGITTVNGIADLASAAVVTHLPLSFLGSMASVAGFVTAANNGSAIGMVFTAVLLPTVHLAARRLFGFLSRSESAKLERVVEELAEVIGASAREGSDSTGAT
jgi:hypothetical protein